MLIYKYEIPNELIFGYCKVITSLEKNFSAEMEEERAKIHEKIFDCADCNRACVTRNDRRFSTALMHTVVDLTFVE